MIFTAFYLGGGGGENLGGLLEVRGGRYIAKEKKIKGRNKGVNYRTMPRSGMQC